MRRWDNLVEKYLAQEQARGIATATIVQRQRELARFGLWLKARKPRPAIEDVSSEHIVQYLAARGAFRSRATVAGSISILRSMGEFLVVEGLQAMLSKYNLSAATLQLMLLDAESPQGAFADLATEYLGRRAAGTPLGARDFELLQRMLVLAESIPVREAAYTDPTWQYSYSAAGDVTQVTLLQGSPPLVRTSYCYRYDARRRLTKVEWLIRRGAAALLTSPPCEDPGLTTMAEYRYTSNNLRVYSKVLGLETHFLFSPEGQVLAEADGSGALQRQYIYLGGEPLAQVVLQEGSSNRPSPAPTFFGCSSAGSDGRAGLAWSVALAAFLLLSRRRALPRRGEAAAALAALTLASCVARDGSPGQGNGGAEKPPKKQQRQRPALIPSAPLNAGDPVYFFHNDRLGTPIRLTDEAGTTVWRAEYRSFGDPASIDVDVDRDGVPVENNLRLPGQYDEALATVFLLQSGPYQNHHRWYSPDLGRYLQPEPYLQKPGMVAATAKRGHSVSAYAYARNNPIRNGDPTGLDVPIPQDELIDMANTLCEQCQAGTIEFRYNPSGPSEGPIGADSSSTTIPQAPIGQWTGTVKTWSCKPAGCDPSKTQSSGGSLGISHKAWRDAFNRAIMCVGGATWTSDWSP